MDLKDYPRQGDGLTQFAHPPCYELAGQSFTFVMDGGIDYELEFGRTEVSWRAVGEPATECAYDCRKADDLTYLVTFRVTGDGPTACHTYVIDLEQRLVTRHTCVAGENPRHPHLLTDRFDFGAIRTEGYQLPYKRHYYTDDLLGTTVEWHWTTDLISRHAYVQTNFYRVTWAEGSAMESAFEDEFYKIPATDELARYIRVKEGIYIFVVTEEKVERLLDDDQPFRSDSMFFIENFDRCTQVGRAFGAMMVDGVPEPLYMIYSGYGNAIELPEHLLTAPNRYVT